MVELLIAELNELKKTKTPPQKSAAASLSQQKQQQQQNAQWHFCTLLRYDYIKIKEPSAPPLGWCPPSPLVLVEYSLNVVV